MAIPIFEAFINPDDDNSGVDFVALVDDPAIQMAWRKFNSDDPKRYEMRIADEERRIISGPLMVANLPIPRMDMERGKYAIVYRPATIEQIVMKFFRKGYSGNVNLMHDLGMKTTGAFMFESFIVDSKRGIHSPEGYNLPDGSWFGSYKITDDKLWEAIKAGVFTGFSVEGYFSDTLIRDEEEELVFKIWQAIQQGNQ